ncbi:MAG: PilT/PilU family type 4a pilus ATPase [Thermoanaerobaculum sp.]|nr:PilT/PilU family type 4a pilus ATPase [Thermoanaerobaculum sp.]MCX7896027.1 PilT/PilU family type 4a pilus ATPase [Thermoanaerobaculum sp.]MDW7967734.1 PilT/PilU family type 4a pilus ATPase [Thermoanaerobaculum sp.]
METSLSLDDLLRFMTKKGASDLHLKPMRPPMVRIDGKLMPIKSPPLKPAEVEAMVLPLLTPAQKQKFDERQSVDIGYGVPGVARFRCNIFQQRGSIAAVFRRIPFEIKSYDDLNLPKVVASFSQYPAGLVLITGPTGSGKSTTLAAIIQDIIKTRPCHVVTIEDPIEFLFSDHLATVSQREVGTDTPSFREALRNAMRQDPDVIMVGEMRDLETIATVITAAETGHLVFSTLHTNSASQTVDRIIDAFPPEQQEQVRSQLAQVLRAVMSMQLVPRRDGQGLVPAVEILVNSPKIAKHIEAGEIKEIHEEIESSVAYYRMQSMNQSLLALLVNNVIDYRVAMEKSLDPEDLSLKLRKMFPHIEEAYREEGMAPSPGDFAEIMELMEIKKLYEEQEERWRQRMQEKDELIADLQAQLASLRQEMSSHTTLAAELRNQLEALRAEKARIEAENKETVMRLQERIKELNQQIAALGSGRPGQEKPTTGFFKR